MLGGEFYALIQVLGEASGKRESGKAVVESGTAPATVGGEPVRNATGADIAPGRPDKATTRKSGNLPGLITCSGRGGRVGSGQSAKVTSPLRDIRRGEFFVYFGLPCQAAQKACHDEPRVYVHH